MKSIRRSSLWGLVAVAPLILLSGCAGVTSKFKESKSVNFGPFADQTLILLSSLNYDLNPNEVYLLRPYIDPANPDLTQLQESVRLERIFLKGIISYSMEIVNLSESGKSQKEQVKSYRAYLSTLAESVKSRSQTEVLISDDQIKTILDAIANQKTLLEAMQAARPLIVEFNRVNLRLVRDIGTFRSNVVNAVHQKIDEKFSEYLECDQSLRLEKSDVLQGLDLIRTYKLGNPSAVLEIPKIKGLIPKNVAGSDAAGLEKYLADRLVVLTKRQEEIQPDLAEYRELKGKLDRIQNQHDEMIRAGGRAVLAWTNAHQEMANGKVTRAEWFGLSDARDMVSGTARKVVP